MNGDEDYAEAFAKHARVVLEAKRHGWSLARHAAAANHLVAMGDWEQARMHVDQLLSAKTNRAAVREAHVLLTEIRQGELAQVLPGVLHA